jgi:ribosomal-protein-serine acetyltransferase
LFALIEGSREHLGRWLPWVELHTGLAHSQSLIEAGEMQRTMENGCLWGVRTSAGELAGLVEMQWIQWVHRSASLGYWLGDSFQGHGIMTEALRLVCAFSFQELKLNRLEFSIACENTRSLALAERAGFRKEGLRREYECLHGRFLDHFSFALLAGDWGEPSI